MILLYYIHISLYVLLQNNNRQQVSLCTKLIGGSLPVQYVIAEAKRTPRSFFIGLFTVFLVVFFCTFLANVVGQSPIIFFKVAENTVGENDLVTKQNNKNTPNYHQPCIPCFALSSVSFVQVLTPGFGIGDDLVLFPEPLPLLNQSLIDELLEHTPEVLGSAPRWLLLGTVLSSTLANDDKSASVMVLGLDSEREQAIELGRDWTLPALEADEVYISRSAVRQMGLDPDTAQSQTITLRLVLEQLTGVLGFPSLDSDPAAFEEILTELAPDLEVWDEPVDLVGLIGLNSSAALRDLLLVLANNTSVLPLSSDAIQALNLTSLLSSSSSASSSEELLEAVLTLFGDVLAPVSNVTVAINGGEVNIGDLLTVTETLLLESTNDTLTVGGLFVQLYPVLAPALVISTDLTLAYVVESPQGKWAEALGSVAVLELDALWGLLAGGLGNILNFNISVADLQASLDAAGTTISLDLGGDSAFLTPLDVLALAGVEEQEAEQVAEELAGVGDLLNSTSAYDAVLLSTVPLRTLF